MKKRWKILIGIIVLAAIVVLASIVHHFQLKAEVTRYMAELRAKGEPMDLAKVIPPVMLPEHNSAELFTNAASALNPTDSVLVSNQPPMMRMVALGKAMIGWAQLDIREQGSFGATNSWAEIETALQKDRTALNLFRKLPQQPVFDFKLNYSDGFQKMKFSPLAQSKKATQRLAASAMNDLRDGNAGGAAKDIQAMLAIAQGFSHDRLIISELVRMALAQITISANWEWLQSTNISDEQLAGLQQAWEHLSFVEPCENSLLMERAVGTAELSEMRSSNLKSYFKLMDKLAEEGLFERDTNWTAFIRIKGKMFLWRYWWSYTDELRYLHGMQIVLAAPRSARTNYCMVEADALCKNQVEQLGFKLEEADSFWFGDPAKADFHTVLSSSIVTLSRVFAKVVKVGAAKQMVITAIVLKRYQLKHGNYPPDLSSLVPDFISAVPPDPADGNPLRYRLNPDGTFLLYSVGENGRDDGGNPSLKEGANNSNYYWQDPKALDWVWPQPATGAEIQAYYEKRAK